MNIYVYALIGLIIFQSFHRRPSEPTNRVCNSSSFIDTAISKADRNFRKIIQQIHLDDLIIPSQNTQFRIWFEYSDNCGKVIILKKIHEQWTGRVYDYITEVNRNYEVISVNYKSSKDIKPLSGSESFDKKINQFELYTFRTYDEIPNYAICMGTGGVILEIAQHYNYKKNLYPCWESYIDNTPEINSLNQIFKIIQTEFGFSTTYSKISF